ncbi:hypothetical protein KY332_03785 [Candidatus Woesearchaeota archaeon]|nr:hypothetical protein [Candidatus Woesearchaeota archaeon]
MIYRNDEGKVVASNYYEGNLQLRNVTKKIVKEARALVEMNKPAFIAKEVKFKNGKDLYLSSQKTMQVIAKTLQKKYGGEVKISRKLFGVRRQTSKKVYRLTVLYRMPRFKVGDVVKAGAKIMKITRLGNRVYGIDVEKGKKISVDYDKVR